MIVIDSNEAAQSEMEKRLRKLTDEVEVRPLKHGEDYIIEVDNIKVPIQRKASGDYIASISDGRLNNELYELSTHYDLSYLIIEGSISYALSLRGFKRAPYVGALVSASLKRSPEGKQGQIVTVNLETDFDTALFINTLHQQVKKGNFERLKYIPGRKSDPESAKLAMLQQIPGIGLKRAQKLHKEIGSLKEIFEAPEDKLEEVLGRNLGRKVYEFLRRV